MSLARFGIIEIEGPPGKIEAARKLGPILFISLGSFL
jgi:hypothetical protein